MIIKRVSSFQRTHILLLTSGFSRRTCHFPTGNKLWSLFCKILDKRILFWTHHIVIPILVVSIVIILSNASWPLEFIGWPNCPWWLHLHALMLLLVFVLCYSKCLCARRIFQLDWCVFIVQEISFFSIFFLAILGLWWFFMLKPGQY